MRLARVVAGAITAAALAAGTVSLAAPASAATVNYVALGDSYSAGVGAGNYDSSSGSCSRSYSSYPYLWAAQTGANFTDVACSGAKTGDVLSSQLSALNSSTTEVSITIGGNDAGFANTMETCVLSGTSSCLSAVSSAESYARNTLPGLLANTYSQIHSHAPNAHVVVLSYPHLYQVPGSCLFGISDTSRSAINGAADILDGVINKAAANAGFTFADVRGSFDQGHEICGDSDQWLNSTTWPISDSYHPTADGQQYGYLPEFSASA
ncbi:lysophospholipase L1-like esterase [Kitasatospora sp. GP30]|uniref:SGNH/GDSL hydrolase family protein n=1 Tax=Kitasatospora sp. GP30 TaxID=3035084 RepID=UPI000C713044|nr:SGNH/GDSL hydrolase family protein [Kitasatospora sp. GP30]MDH6144980.1 lysophospholipase L1-like esterase [Kitasatospora sp. GP30]